MKLPLALSIVLLGLPVQAENHPQAHAVTVPDHAITIDGRDDDWVKARVGPDARTTSNPTPDHLDFLNPERGVVSGPDDLSMTISLAQDSTTFYVLADVHDQILVNDAGPENCYSGDDFEFFIDANDPAQRYGEQNNENVRQFVFVPGHLNPLWPETFIFQAEKSPGVKAVSRLRPFGYTIEISVPKALFPNWQAHPQLASVGFDATAADADAPGVELIHPANKATLFLLQHAAHFQKPAKLGELVFDAKLQNPPAAAPAPPADEAQAIYDRFDTITSDEVAAALANPNAGVEKAALLVLAQRADLAVPVDLLKKFAAPASDAFANQTGADTATYAILALARRHQLPGEEWYPAYFRIADPALRRTFVWALGRNGDASIVPALIHLFYDGNMTMRRIAVRAAADLHATAALPELKKMAVAEPHHYVRAEIDRAIPLIEGGKK